MTDPELRQIHHASPNQLTRDSTVVVEEDLDLELALLLDVLDFLEQPSSEAPASSSSLRPSFSPLFLDGASL